MSAWPVATLGSVCELYQPQTISSAQLVPDGKYPVYGANGVIGKYDKFNHDAKQLLITCRGATCGAVNVSQPFSWINGNAMVVRPKNGQFDLAYLAHLFRGGLDLRAVITGAAQPQITRQSLAPLRVSIPPVSEQRRIAAMLDQADALRAKRREALAQLDSLTQSIFIEMFGDARSNSMRWPNRAFGQLCETRLGKMLDQKQQTGKHPRPYLRNANVQWHRFELDDVFTMDFDDSAKEVFRLQVGDLMICEGGEPGRAAIWKGQIAECYYQKALHRARPISGIAIGEYLAWLLWFLSKSGGLGDHVTSATIAHLTGEKLKAMNVMVPPLAVQKSFANRIQAVEAVKATHSAALADLNALFASLQHRAFRGEL